MLKLNHKELNVWKSGVEFVRLMYSLTASFPATEKYGITSQLRRAAVSIPSNIAEGAARKSEKERKRFYEIARSSLVEIDTQIEISLSLNYIKKHNIKKAERLANQIFAMLTAMI